MDSRSDRDPRTGREADRPSVVCGINPVLEALRADRVIEVWAVDGAGARVQDVIRAAAAHGVSVRWADRAELTRRSGGIRHQDVAAVVRAGRSYRLEDLVGEGAASGAALLLVLDGIEDPQNLGALLRTADAAGVTGIVRQARRAARLSGAAARASAGAMAHVRVATVVNIARAVEGLKEAGIWTVGLAPEASRRYDEVDLTQPTALVMGAEGTGLRRLVRDRCDWLVSIPMAGHVGSLNVSVAAGVVLFEALRQRRVAPLGGRPGSWGARHRTGWPPPE